MALNIKLPSIDKREMTKGAVRVGLALMNSAAMAPGVALVRATGKKFLTGLTYLGSVSVATFVTHKESEVTDVIVDQIFDSIEAKKEAAMAAKYAEIHFPSQENESCDVGPAE